MTRSYIPIGTIARGEPCVEVVMSKRRPGIRAETNVGMVEKRFSPGPSQPRSSRSRPSAKHRHLLVVTPEVAVDLAGGGPAGKDRTGDDTPLGLPVDARPVAGTAVGCAGGCEIAFDQFVGRRADP